MNSDEDEDDDNDNESIDTVSDDLRNLSTGAVNVIKRFGDYTKSSSRLRRQNEESSRNASKHGRSQIISNQNNNDAYLFGDNK